MFSITHIVFLQFMRHFHLLKRCFAFNCTLCLIGKSLHLSNSVWVATLIFYQHKHILLHIFPSAKRFAGLHVFRNAGLFSVTVDAHTHIQKYCSPTICWSIKMQDFTAHKLDLVLPLELLVLANIRLTLFRASYFNVIASIVLF